MRKTYVSLFAIAVCLLFCSHAAAQDFITEISTPAQLQALATQVNNGNDYSGRIVTLTADINLSDYPAWNPIGIYAYDRHFNGTFDGNGHRITNLQVNASASETGYVAGLFGIVGLNGTVRDVTVESITVAITKDNLPEGANPAEYPYGLEDDITCYVGSIAGQNLGTIVGCANRGVSVYGNWNQALVGGIAGENRGSIQNCYNLGEVYTGSYSNNYLGGIAGQNGEGGIIRNCFVRATIDEDRHAFSGPICGNAIGSVSGCFYMDGTPTDGITDFVIYNDASNVLSAVGGQTKNVLIADRTIYSDAAWNTLCLPFDVPASGNGRSPIAGASVKELDVSTSSFNTSSGLLTLNFTDALSIEAGKPYIVKWDEAIASNLSNPVFMDVVVSSEEPTQVSAPNVDFIGIYSPLDIASEDKSLLYLGAENYLYYPNGPMTIGSCRAYFHVKLDSEARGITSFVLNFGDETTAIRNVVNSTPHSTWHTLDGRRLSDKPGARGVYVSGGRKIVIK